MIGFIKKFLNSDFTKPLNTLIDEVKATLALIKAKTDTITADLFTATHASRIDANISSRQADAGLTSTHASRIDASISSRASQASVDAIKAKTDLIVTGMGGIKSVQRGFTNIDGYSKTITISPVNVSKAFLIFSNRAIGTHTNTFNPTTIGVTGSIETATTLVFNWSFNNSFPSANQYVTWQVVEFY